MNNWEQIYREKLRTPEEAARLIQDGDFLRLAGGGYHAEGGLGPHRPA